MRNVITVGIGDYYSRILEPTLKKMQNEGLIRHIATVDVKSANKTQKDIEHVIRSSEPLSQTLNKFMDKDPMVILAHTNHMHIPDTIDLSSKGFKVALEKPYALHLESLRTLLRDADLKNVYLLEYYLMMKSAPLLFGYGKIKKDSFYLDCFKPREGLSGFAVTLEEFFNKLSDIVGDINSVQVDVLEGEGEVGRLDHRGVATSDIRAGGGMMQDMLIHAIAPIVALEDEVGRIKSYDTKVAICREYADMARLKFGLKDGHIGESYIEVSINTDKKIPINIRVGKYVYGDRNVRGVRINGSKKNLFLDMNSCVLYVDKNPVLEIPKDEYKYYAVIRSAVEFFCGSPLYNFNQNLVSSKAQEFVLHIQDGVYRTQVPKYYKAGEVPEKIFKK